MIGDGTNDCTAISQADVGISFSSADAAYAAPFTVNLISLNCVEVILRCGKAMM